MAKCLLNSKLFRNFERLVIKFQRYNSGGCPPPCPSPPKCLKDIIKGKIECELEKVKKFRQKDGNFIIDKVKINQIYLGMRDIKSMLCETSHLDNNKGILFRGFTIDECKKKLPCLCEEPLPEGIFWLLVTGDVPTPEQAKMLSVEWAERGKVPDHVKNMLDNFPRNLHPMAQMSCAVTALNRDSKFLKAFNKGIKKNKYWEFIYEDAMDLIGKITPISAIIYQNVFKGKKIDPCLDPCRDWAANLCTMMGYDNPAFHEHMRMYLTIHCDHGSGNISAHAATLVCSALADPYLSFAAGMNGLAGPLHGLAAQESLMWIFKMKEKLGKKTSDGDIKKFAEDTLKSGRVIPGFGHAVLRITDPRYTAQRNYAMKHLPKDPNYSLVEKLFKVVPPVLKATGKVKNPWPNVDANSGALLYHYGVKEMHFYTVLFGVSRCLGIMAQLIWTRIYGMPIERPLSYTTDELMKIVAKSKKNKC